jgi:hypothetical protein
MVHRHQPAAPAGRQAGPNTLNLRPSAARPTAAPLPLPAIPVPARRVQSHAAPRRGTKRRLGGKTLLAVLLILAGFILGLRWVRLPQTGYTYEPGFGRLTYFRPADVPQDAERRALVTDVVMADYLEPEAGQPYTDMLTFRRIEPLLRTAGDWVAPTDRAQPND